jgi:hypothetical protein
LPGDVVQVGVGDNAQSRTTTNRVTGDVATRRTGL